MIEILLSVLVVGLAALGLGIGLVLGRGPAQGTCAATACLKRESCITCPNRQTDTPGERA